MSRLVALGGPDAGRHFSLDGPECIVGRRLDCHIAIQDQRISRRHARFFRGEDGPWVEDLGSVNGTFVNGRRVSGSTRLAHGDEVAIGSTRFRVELGGGRAEPAAFADPVAVVAQPEADVVEVTNLQESRSHLRRAGLADPLREVERLQHKLRTVYKLGEAVAQALEPRALLDQVVTLLLEVFPQAVAAAAVTPEPRSGEVRTAAYRRRGGGSPPDATVLPRAVFDRVMGEGHSVLLRVARARPSAPGGDRLTMVTPAAPGDVGEITGLRMGAPLVHKGERLGLLHVEADPEVGAFTQADLDLLGGIAAQTSTALQMAWLHQRLLMRDRLDKDLAIARQIQRNLLPREAPRISGIEFGVHYEPAFQVGGDFYDFLWLGPRQLGLIVGDVSGKAISGALFMARVASEFRAVAPLESDPRRLLQRVNRATVEVSDDGMFCTALVMVIDLERHVVRFANAGHTAPMLRRGGVVRPLEFPEARTAPLGLAAEMQVELAEVALRPGDTLVLYTDGLIEARSRGEAMYGQERLTEVLARAPGSARGVLDALLRDLDAFVEDAPQADDQTIVCLTVTADASHRCDSSPPPPGAT